MKRFVAFFCIPLFHTVVAIKILMPPNSLADTSKDPLGNIMSAVLPRDEIVVQNQQSDFPDLDPETLVRRHYLFI